NEIAERIPSGRLLDWGCGFGQMTYLLRRRGFDVTAFDVGAEDASLPQLPLCRDLHIVRTAHPTRLPFPNDSFDAVLSCGVLEHARAFYSRFSHALIRIDSALSRVPGLNRIAGVMEILARRNA